MIVNPQIFNYRLIISSLIVVLIALGVYSYSSYEDMKSHEVFLKQEKQLIESELSAMLENYEEISQDYELVSEELEAAKKEIQSALDSLKVLNGNLEVVTKYKAQLRALKTKNAVLLETIDSLSFANEQLLTDKQRAYSSIRQKNRAITSLEYEKDSLYRTIDKAALIAATNVDAKPFKLTRSNKKRPTSKARRADALDICITLAENPLADSGKKDIYIQILTPDNNVLSDQGAVTFGETTLIYSKKEVIKYTNETIDICSMIKADNNDKPLQKGIYYVNVFNDERMLNSSTFELN
jgi:hypothetical protein